jgi:hypothetical protein
VLLQFVQRPAACGLVSVDEELDRENAVTRPGIARDSIRLDSKSRYNKSSKVSTLVIELSSEVNEPT